MQTKEYIQLTNKRAGVEGIPSVIRRKYQVDSMPVRGLLRSKLWFSFKIGAYNFNKLLRYLGKKGILAFNYILNTHSYTFIGNLTDVIKIIYEICEYRILKMPVFGV